MCVNSDIVLVRRIRDGLQLLIIQAALRLNDIHTAPDVIFSSLGGFLSVVYDDLAVIRKNGGSRDDPWAGHTHAGSRNLVLVDLFANANAFFEWRSQIDSR